MSRLGKYLLECCWVNQEGELVIHSKYITDKDAQYAKSLGLKVV